MNHPSTHPIIAEAAAFGAEYIEPNAERWEQQGSVPREFFQAAGATGLCGLLVPTALGGSGLSVIEFSQVLTALSRHCMSSTFALVVHNNLVASIAKRGQAAQIERYVPAMLSGDQIGAFLLTEPSVGSDATAITTQAVKSDQGWTLSGSKAWVSNARNADVLSVYAQTEAGTGAKGIAGFLVDARSAGIQRQASYDLLGNHALGTGGFEFNQCQIGDSGLFLAPGEAFKAAMQGIDLARVAVAAMCCGILARALDVAITYTKARTAFGATVGDFQGVQWMLADCATELQASRALTERAAVALEQNINATLAAAHAKKYASRVAFNRVADCMQVMGAAGLARNFPLARHLAAAKMAQYVDGASEIQNVVIARALMQD